MAASGHVGIDLDPAMDEVAPNGELAEGAVNAAVLGTVGWRHASGVFVKGTLGGGVRAGGWQDPGTYGTPDFEVLATVGWRLAYADEHDAHEAVQGWHEPLPRRALSESGVEPGSKSESDFG